MRTLASLKLAGAPARLMQRPVARILAGLACVMAPVALLAPATRYYASGPATRVLFACVSVLLILAAGHA